LKDKIVELISSIFYLGYLPLRGTLASILAIGVYLLFKNSIYLYLFLTTILTLLGFLVCSEAEKIYKEVDSKKIVIDDFCGMLFSFILFPRRSEEILSIFIVFRILDFLKPYPASRLEKIPGSRGIMLDDLVASLYTNLVYLLFLFFEGYFKFT
jgi:phosphatidylglycerophosphatase A